MKASQRVLEPLPDTPVNGLAHRFWRRKRLTRNPLGDPSEGLNTPVASPGRRACRRLKEICRTMSNSDKLVRRPDERQKGAGSEKEADDAGNGVFEGQ